MDSFLDLLWRGARFSRINDGAVGCCNPHAVVVNDVRWAVRPGRCVEYDSGEIRVMTSRTWDSEMYLVGYHVTEFKQIKRAFMRDDCCVFASREPCDHDFFTR